MYFCNGRHTIQHMSEDWRAKLQRLGVVKGTRHLKSAPPLTDMTQPVSAPIGQPGEGESGVVSLEVLLPGLQLAETSAGMCLVREKVYPLSYRHGMSRVGDLLAFSPASLAVYLDLPGLEGVSYGDVVFLDTETTGLAGAGTVAFMVGVAFFADDVLIVRQYFLRNFGDEPAMLVLLGELLGERRGLVTFNGRSFDIPLLDGRYLLNRMPGRWLDLPHIDLLSPARRLWRPRLGSCALSALEISLLGVKRTQEDVPGWLIPTLYHNYLRSGDGRELVRVFYHNEVDMLSMVTLAVQVAAIVEGRETAVHPIDLISLGKWQNSAGLTEAAEQSFRQALAADLPLPHYHEALYQLAYLLKRSDRRSEAVPLWQQIATTSFEDVTAHVELAKHYEWHEVALETAVYWTQQAINLARHWPDSQGCLVLPELTHRLKRLTRKLKQAENGRFPTNQAPE